jgi:hypothetical protein
MNTQSYYKWSIYIKYLYLSHENILVSTESVSIQVIRFMKTLREALLMGLIYFMDLHWKAYNIAPLFLWAILYGTR